MKLNQEFVPLNLNEHQVKSFDCMKKCMNEFLIKFAAKHAKQGISTTMVLTCNKEDSSATKLSIAAYYTLALSTVRREDIPYSGLPTYAIPVTLLARLAVDVTFQGKKVGTKSLIYALRHAAKLSTQGLPTHGLMLDVLDTEALSFYQSFNFFQEVTHDPMKLYVSMKELQNI